MTSPLEHAFIDLAHAQKKPPIWVLKDFIPAGLTFLAGPPKKSYKSTLTIIKACLCARWTTTALPPWVEPILGGPTMMFSAEADAGEVLYVVEDGLKVKVMPGHIYVAQDPWQFQLDMPGAVEQLVDYLDTRDPQLVIMDPFRNMWSGDENDSAAIIQTLGPIRKWAHDNGAAVILVHHINKPSELTQTGSMFTMRGSSAIPGLADGIIVIEPTKTEGQIIVHTTFKRGTSWRRTIQLGVPGYGWPSDGYEVLPELALAIREAWSSHKSARDLGFLADLVATHKSTVGSVRSQLEALMRNGLVQMSMPEQLIFLGGQLGGQR